MITRDTPSKMKLKAIRLWEQQDGICWVCGFPMLRPRLFSDRSPSGWEVTVDHIGEKNGKPRPVKGAHQECNSARGHREPSEISSHVRMMATKYRTHMKSIFKEPENART